MAAEFGVHPCRAGGGRKAARAQTVMRIDWAGEPAGGAGAIERAYRAETRGILAGRVPIGVVIFLAFIATASGLEWVYMPERTRALQLVYLAYVFVCLAQLALVRRAPAWTVATTALATNTLALCQSAYFARVHGNAEICVLLLALFLTGLVLLYPWGLRGQLLGSLGAVIGYPLALNAGAVPTLPAPYGIFALVTAVALTALGAHLLDTHRRAAYRRAVELERAGATERAAQEFSAALLEVAHALNATITEPRALGEQLTARTRAALGADWAALFRWDEPAQLVELAAASGAPPEVVEEVRTLRFSPELVRQLYPALAESGSAEIPDRDRQATFTAALLERWGIRSCLAQAITRDGRVIGLLGCCYTGRRGAFPERSRRLLAAIANQAAVALENAHLVEDARTANRVKSEFVATVSHELRTPLNVIVGYTDLLLEGVFGPPAIEQRDALQRVRHQSMQLLALIQTILDLNRLEARSLPLTVEAFTVEEVFEHLRAGIPASWRRNGVRLRWEAPAAAAVLRSDRSKVEMILRNLIHNALKYTDTGAVTVSAEPGAAGGVRFAVRDTGTGIAAEDLPTIFEMFRQGRSGSRDGGVGLGLSIVRGLAGALGGEVQVDSELGAGTCFTVTLPAELPAPRAAA